MTDILIFLLNVTAFCFSLFVFIKVRQSGKRTEAYLKRERERLEKRKALLDELDAERKILDERFQRYLKMDV